MSNFFLILITIVCWGIGSLFYKLANDNMHPIMVSCISTALYVVLIPIGFKIFKVPLTANGNGILYAFLGGLGMCLGSLAYFFALQKGSAGAVTASAACYPALTLILSAIILKEEINITKIIGCVFALASVYLLTYK
jgi:transporter family protein